MSFRLLASTFTLCLFATIALGLQRNITVDDTDPAISYAGSGWKFFSVSDSESAAQFTGLEYNGTVHRTCGSQSPTGTATFKFTGVAIYYSAWFCLGWNFTTITLDGGDPIVVPTTASHDSSDFNHAVWAMTGLSNSPHTIVNSALPPAGGPGDVSLWAGGLDEFIYTVGEPDDVPPPPAGFKNVFLSADAFSYSKGWTNSSASLPSCVQSSQVHTTSIDNSTFSFNFTGDELFLNTLVSPSGGQLSLSINGGEPEVFDTTAPAASCALLNLNVTALVKRSIMQRRDGDSNAQNRCSGKSTGTNGLDAVTYVILVIASESQALLTEGHRYRQMSSGVHSYNSDTLLLLVILVVLIRLDAFT
ncbi:hypothetical protein DFH09DRAFT_197632 [Mycena vulgaris]|nr:hypothetical protein DFH09DRAFT_197632 [Mycena vulgaris]